PNYVQRGAGEYPFSYPETACIGAFILAHPNIAAVQSYHNSGGMILRGPGAKEREAYYPRSDVAVYDEIAKTGERILPYYRSMTIWKDLYTVHGGFVNWTSEGLGIFSFTNELWANAQYYYGKEGDWPPEEQRLKFGDLLQFGELWVPLKPYDHPTYGEILIGGWNQYASRVPPIFMLEELCHRNFAFTMYHADQMPKLSFSRVRVKALDPGIWEVTAEVKNAAAIPSISAVAASKKIGARDQVSLRAAQGSTARVLTSGTLSDWLSRSMTLTKRQPERMWVDSGVGSHSQLFFRWIVEGAGSIELEYKSQKAGTIRTTAELEPTEPKQHNAE
ncbi:MAG: peptidase M14, partial [Planctomycetes bacterium]|nr:peptidase M14 [Planctomycetota bacterium]